MNYTKRSRISLHGREDSFIVSDSEEDVGVSFKEHRSVIDARVIGDSDSESVNSQNVISEDDESYESVDSEAEDLQFMNNSHKVSIIEDSSESESDEEKVQRINLKRRSIYDNPSTVNTPTSESTPINSHFRKRAKRIIINSDSESADASDNQGKEDVGRSQKNILCYDDTDQEESDRANIEKYSASQEKNDETNFGEDSVDEEMGDEIQSKENDNMQENNSELEQYSAKASTDNENLGESYNSTKDRSDIRSSHEENSSFEELSMNRMNRSKLGRAGTKNSSLFEKNTKLKNNVVDLTINDSGHDHSLNITSRSLKNKENIVPGINDSKKSNSEKILDYKSLRKQQKNDDAIIISSSSGTSENEIDTEAITLAKKEIGVGNVDFIEAQKQEHLLLNIEFTQKQLDKLNKFAESVDINLLPDKGKKVHETIKEHEQKLATLREQMAKLKNVPNIEKLSTPKKKISPTDTIKNERKALISPLNESRRNSNSSLTDTIKKEKRAPLSPLNKSRRNSNSRGNSNNASVKTENTMKKDRKSNETNFPSQFNDFDIKDIPNVPEASFDTADLGKKALETLNKQQTLTHQSLEHLHGSLTSRPTEKTKAKDPMGLKVPLMAHQQHALAWMQWREKQKPKGGILADDMGLGKTLTMISLVLATVNDKKVSNSDSDDSSSSDDGWISRNKKKHKRYYGGTLVICPASLIKQWEAEVKNRVKRGLLDVLVYHGNNRSMEDRKLSKFNIVVTTYQIIVREADSQTGMYRMEWNRIILDEAHYIRNHKSKACLAICGLSAKHRWALSGTPIQNKEMDLYAILKFLKCSPFDDFQVWKRWVDNKNDAGKQRLITIMKTLMLRRTKQELQAKGDLESLPDKLMELIEIQMDREENLVYQKVLLFSQNLFAQFLAQRADKQHMKELHGGKFDRPSYSNLGAKTQFTKAQKVLLEHHKNIEASEILVLLLRLRQICCHPALIHAMLDKHDVEVNGLDEEEESEDLLNKLHNMSLNDDAEVEEHVANYKIDERVAKNVLTKSNPVFDDKRQSSKVRAILKTVEEILDKEDKLIIVSQWTSFLKVIAKNLKRIEDANYAMFTGEVAVKDRQAIVDKLNDPNEDVNILLLSLTAGGVGLNLVGANHLLLVDIHWNPQLEAQAQDRIYRFGQNKDVNIYKFICKDTIEERVKNLQDKKLDIANHVLTGTRSISSKLTIDDLKLLFS